MFTILDGINRFLSFLNFNLKLKNKIYIFLGFFTTGYVGYLAYNFLSKQAYARGIIYTLIFLVLAYFLILNFLYYFTDKTVKWDISPLFEKFVVEHAEEKAEKEEKITHEAMQIADQLVIYDKPMTTFSNAQILPAEVLYFKEAQQVIKELADFMIQHQLVKKDYGGISEKKLSEKTYAIAGGIIVPSYSLTVEKQQLILAIGLNAMERTPIATVTTIGGMKSSKMLKNYELIPAKVKIIGGEFKLPGRSGTIVTADAYQVELEVACLTKV